jgi:Flp pilus assembly protein TadG
VTLAVRGRVGGGGASSRLRRHAERRRGAVGANESGQVGGIEAVAFGMLVLVLGVLIIGNAWGVIDAKEAASDAAREAARTFATAPAATDAQADALAREAALDTANELGWSRPGVTVRRTAGVFVRCALVTYEVSIPVPVFRLPWIKSSVSAFRATASHTETVDPYRSAVPGPGAALCAPGGP